ncbi:MAG TPA: gamma subclass chorismate mutase AroQ [Pseudomonadales bacterium]
MTHRTALNGALGLVLTLALLGPVGASPVTDGPEELYRLIDARLELMDEVAAFKWQSGLPVEDREREAVVLEQAVTDALHFGFTPETSRAFFEAQIEAAKSIQRHWLERWQAGEEPPQAADLNEAIRPELSRLGSRIIAAAASAGAVDRERFEAAVAVTGLDPGAREQVFAALEGLKRFEHRLQQILETRVLRVGTTGDYAPFSHRGDATETPRGIDIDLARRLADALEVDVAFVETSWPTLLDDLAAGRFDIAMSGVSRTLDRQRVGYLSVPYYVGGKTAIARCGEAARFGSLEGIDRPAVRVIVNPGGTNEAFVDAHLHRARKVLHQDNRTIFDALAAGAADVMITDRVEVELQTARNPELCAAAPENFTYQEKAYLMPQDTPWKEFVNTWLELAIADGTVAAVFRDHGVEPRLPDSARPDSARPDAARPDAARRTAPQ